MKRVLKYELPISTEFIIEMPWNAEILSVQLQREVPCLWALVETENQPMPYKFIVRGTGHAFTGDEGKYIGTVLCNSGALVWHFFLKRGPDVA